MKTWMITLSTLLFAAVVGTFAAHAHVTSAPHAHPHLHVQDGALLWNDAFVLLALGLFALAAARYRLARRRHR